MNERGGRDAAVFDRMTDYFFVFVGWLGFLFSLFVCFFGLFACFLFVCFFRFATVVAAKWLRCVYKLIIAPLVTHQHCQYLIKIKENGIF